MLGYLILVWMSAGFIIMFSNGGFVTSTLYRRLAIDSLITAMALGSLPIGRSVFILSDRSNLLSFGVDRIRLLKGFSIFLFILGFPIFIIFTAFSEGIALTYPVSLGFELPSVFVLFPALIFLSLYGLSRGPKHGKRVILLIGVLNFSNLLGNPFSMGNIFTSNYLYALVVEAVFLVSISFLAFRSARDYGFSYGMTMENDKKVVIRHPLEMKERRGVRSEFRFWFLLSPMYSNVRRDGQNLSVLRSTLSTQLIINSALFTSLSVVLVYLREFSSPTVKASAAGVFLVFFAVYGIIFSMILSYAPLFNSISHDRLWISLGSIKNATALRTHLLAKSLASVLLTAPVLILTFSLAIIRESVFGVSILYPSIFLVAAMFPSMVASQVITAYLSPEQVHDDTIPQQGFLWRLASTMPELFVLFSALIGMFYPVYLIWAFVALLVISMPLLFSSRVFEREAFSMIKRGFV